MYIALTHKLPFYGNGQKQIFSNILNKDYKAQALSKFSENTRDLISKLLERDVTIRINAETALSHKFF